MPIPDGSKLSDVQRILGDALSRDIAGLLQALREADCNLEEWRARANEFQADVENDAVSPEPAAAPLPEVGAQVPMYGQGAPS